MKANKLFFCALASVLSFQAMSPDSLLSIHSSLGRMPASEAIQANKQAVEVVVCKSELKGEKLEADVKKLLDDKEEVLKHVDGHQKENKQVKLQTTSAPEVKTDEKNEAVAKEDIKMPDATESKSQSKSQAKSQTFENKSDSSELIALMVQMTSMFTAQMQSQMQMQMQIMNMFSQMQTNINPYGQSLYSNNFMNNNSYGYPTLNNTLGAFGSGVGISAQSSPWSNYSNPYSAMPTLNRQQIFAPSDFGFSFNNQIPDMNRVPAANRGFDFSQSPAAPQRPVQVQPQEQIPAPQIQYGGAILSA